MGKFIQKIAGFVLLALLPLSYLSAQTNVSGNITANMTWTKVNSPYILIGNIGVSNSVILTIEPGVEIIRNGDFTIMINGSLTAIGTTSDSIKFSSNVNTPSNYFIDFQKTNLSNSTLNFIRYNNSLLGNVPFLRIGNEAENAESTPKNTGSLTLNNSFFNGAYLLTKGYSTSANLRINNSVIDNSYLMGAYPRTEPIIIENTKISNSILNSDSYNYGITLKYCINNKNSFIMGCCGANFTLDNSKFINCGFGGRGDYGKIDISKSIFINTPISYPSSTVNIYSSIFKSDKNNLKVPGNGFYVQDTVDVLVSIGSGSISNTSINSSAYYDLKYSSGNSTLVNSTLSNSPAGVYFSNFGTVTLTNVNFYNIANYFLFNNATKPLTVNNTYFNGLSGSALSAKIFDYTNDLNKGVITLNGNLGIKSVTAPISYVSNVVKTLSGGQVLLTWTPNTETDITGYKVYYGGYTGYSYTNTIDVGNVTSTTLPAGVSIDEDFSITAYDASKDGVDDQLDGNESWFSPASKLPNAPTNISASATGHKVKLNWDKSPSAGVNNYNVYRSTDGVSYTKLISTTTNSYTNIGLTAYTKYYYKVSAFDSLDLSYDNYGLESSLTAAVNATPTNRFYVDSALGNDATGIGSIESPYKKISAAVTASITGDTIYVGKGTYLDNVILTKELTIIAQLSQTKTIVKPLLPTSQIFNFTTGSARSKLSGFTLTGGGNVRGSAIDCNFSSPIIENCIITNSGGEAPIHFYYTDAVFNNCIIYKNTGSSVFFYDPNDKFPTINHTTIAFNSGIGTGSSNISFIPVFTNCIIHGNSGGSTGGNISILNSIIQGGYLGNQTNIDSNPSFVDSVNNDYHLLNFSPAIGLGTNIPSITKDFENNNRILPISSNPDAGAYESIYDHPSPFLIDSARNGFVYIKINQNPKGVVNKFRIYKSNSNNPITKTDSTLLVSSYTDSLNQIFNTPLYYRVTSLGPNNLESGYSNELRTIAFNPPVLASPIDKFVKADLSINFKWATIPNATKYKLQFSTDSNFINGVSEINQIDTSYSKSGLIDNTTYYWKVQTWDSLHYSVWSKINRFQTYILPPTFTKLMMGNKIDTLFWTVANSTNLKYFKIYRDTVAEPVKLLDSIAGNLTTYIDTNKLQLNVRYYYRIIAGNNQNLESDYSNILNGKPFNRPPVVTKLLDKTFPNVGEFNSVRTTFSAVGSSDVDGSISSFRWYVNDSLVNSADSILIYYFNQGFNNVKLVVTDNQDAKDSSLAIVSLSSFSKSFKGGFLGGITALSQDRIITADSTFDPVNGASVYMLDRSGNTIFPLIVSSKIFTTPSVSTDSSVFITSGSSLNGFNKSGAPLWSTIPLGGNSFVTPTIDSLLSRIYLGVSNKNFFAIDYKTGKVAWNIIGDDAINASAVITGDRKLVFTSQSGTLYGFDIRTNAVQTASKWKYTLGEIVTKSPAVDASNNLYIGTDAGNLVKLTLKDDGTVLKVWSVKLSGSIQSSAVIDADGFVYIGNEKGDFYKISPSDGVILWTYSSGGAIRSTPAISDFGSIYFANLNGLLTSLSSDKTVKWRHKEPSAISANLLYINNMVYAGTESGKLFSIYDNPSTNTVNTSLSIIGTPSYIETFKIKSMALTEPIISKKPIWGTFQGNYRRTGSRNFDCPDIPIVNVPSCITTGDTIRVSTSDLTQKYWVLNDKNLDTKDTVIYIKPTDKIKIIAYNSIGCNVSSVNTFSIPNSDVTKPTIVTSTGTDRFCQTDSIILSTPSIAANYQWNFAGYPITNAKNKTLSTNLSGAYSVSVTNSYGCKSSSDISLIMATVKPEAPSISRDTSGSLISSAISGNQWYKAGVIIPGATSRTYKPSIPSMYSVTTNNYGCTSVFSATYYFIVTDIINISSSEFIKLAPNPFSNKLNLDFVVKGYQRLNMEVFDIATGSRVAAQQNLMPGIPIYLGQLSAGTYLIKVFSDDFKISYQFKMIKI